MWKRSRTSARGWSCSPLSQIPPSVAQQELTLYIALGTALRFTGGFAAPEVAATYHRARELCQHVGETPQLVPVLIGLSEFYINRGEFQTARELAEQMLSLAQRVQDPACFMNAHIALGNALSFLGELGSARAHLEHGIALYLEQGFARSQPLQHCSHGLINPQAVVHGLSRLAQVLWMLGYPDQALQRSQEALTLAQEFSHPFSVATALFFAAQIHCWRREGHLTYEQASAALMLSGKQGFALRLAQATILQGWALVEQGQGEAGMAQIRQGLAARRASGVWLQRIFTCWPRHLGRQDRSRKGCGRPQRRWYSWTEVRAGGWRSCIGSRGGCCWRALPSITRRLRAISVRPLRQPAGQVLGAARGDEPESAVAAAGQADRRAEASHTNL
jgi:tetratricopeptide (TPR) repeat protein